MADFNLSAEVSMDVDPLKASKTTIERNLKAINKSLRDQRKEMKQNEVSAESLAKQESDLGRAIKLQEGLMAQRNKELQDQQKEMAKSNKVTDEQKIKLQNLNAAYEKSKKQLNGYQDELNSVQVKQKTFGKTTDDVKNNLNELRNEVKKSQIEFEKSSKATSDYERHIDSLTGSLNKSEKQLGQLDDNLKIVSELKGENSREAKELRSEISKEQLAFQQLGLQLSKAKEDFKNFQEENSDSVMAMRKLEEKSKDVKGNIANLRNEVKKSQIDFEKSNKSTEDYEKHLDSLNHSLITNENQLSELEDNLRKVSNLQGEGSFEAKNLRNEISKEQLAFKQLELQLSKTQVEFNKYQEENSESAIAARKLEERLEGLSDESYQVKNSLGQLRDQTKLMELRFKQSSKTVDGYENHIKNLSYTMTKQSGHINLLKSNLKELENAQQGNSREADKIRNDILKESIAFQVLQGRIDETTDELKKFKRANSAWGTLKGRVAAANEQINRIGDNFRNFGYVATGVIRGGLIANFTTLIPIMGSIISLGAGIGGMLVAASGGAIGMGGAFAIAGVAVQAFAGQATYALKMLEDGQLKVTKEVTAYKGALDGLKTSWEGLIAQNQAAIFNTMTNGINTAKYALTTLNPFLTKTATQIETASGKMLNWAKTSSVAKRSFDILNTQGPKIFQHLLNATQSFVNGSAAMFNKLSPLYGWAAKGFADMARSFDNWANSVQGSKAINGFIEYTKTNLPIVGSIFGNVFSGIVSLFQAFSGHSHDVLLGIQGVTESFKQWAAQLQNSQGFKDFLAYIKQNGPVVWQLIKNIGTGIWGLLKGMAPVGAVVLGITTAVTGFVSSLMNAHPWLGTIVGILGTLIGVGLAVVPIITILGNAIGGLSSILSVASLAVKGVGMAISFLGGPITLIILAVGAFVGVIIHLWKTNETFRNNVIAIWNSIKSAATAVFGFIKPYIIAIWNGIKIATTVVWNAIKKTAVTVWNAIKFAVQHPIQALKIVLNAYWNAMKNQAIKVWNLLKKSVVAVTKALSMGVKLYITAVKTVVSNVFNATKNIAIKIWTLMKNRIIANAKLLWSGVRNTFNALRKGITSIFNAVKNISIKVWTTIKNGVVSRSKSLWTGVRNIFNALNKGVRNIFNSVKNSALKLWTNMRNGIVSRAKSLWNGVRNVWNSLKKGTVNLFNSVSSFLSKKWNAIKSSTVSKAKALWSGVKNIWSSLSKGTRNVMNAVGSFMSKKWNGIKNSVVNIVNNLKSKVTSVMSKMADAIKNITSKIKGFFSGMIGKVKEGLNKLIEGVNFVGKKLGMDKIDPINFHTGTTHTQTNLVKNGKIAKDTLATVGDKGKGNGPNGFRHETIIPPKGKPFITPNRDTTMPISKGTAIMNGAQTHAMLSANNPTFSTGTNPAKQLLKRKKNKHKGDTDGTILGKGGGAKDALKSVGGAIGDTYNNGKDWVGDKAQDVGKGVKDLAGKIGEKVGDVMDYVKNPGKLLGKILKNIGLNMSSFGIPKAASLPYDMMKASFNKLKKAATELIKGWLEDAEGGDGDAGWLLKHPLLQSFGFYKGMTMNGTNRHWGLDFGMPVGTSVKAVTAGKIIDASWSPYGGGNQVTLEEPGGKWFQWWMHNSKFSVKKGDKVNVGDELAKSGNTGSSNAPHVHFQRMKGGLGNDKAVDPMSWLKSLGSGGSKSASKWKSDIKRAAKTTGVNLSSGKLNDIAKLIQTESGGRAGVTQQVKDQNSGGNEARGLLQYTPGTFKGYATKGKKNILNGYHQLLAFFNNSNWSSDLAAWKRRMAAGSTGWGPTGSRRGYATGTNNARRGFNRVFEEGGEIMQMHGGETVIPNDVSIQAFKQIATSDIFQKTQSAVYDGISRYANELRNERQMKSAIQQQAILKQQQETQDLKEQNSILKEMLYTMQGILQSSKNNETYNKATSEKDMSLNGRLLNKNNNEQQALNMATSLMGR